MNMGNTKKPRTRSLTDSIPKSSSGGILRSTLKGYLFSLIIGAVMTLVLSALVYSLSDPNRYIAPVAFCILYISALFGGYLSAKFNRGSALLCGALYSAMMLLSMLTASLFFGGSYSADYSLPLAIGLRGIAAALAVIGAMISTHKQPKKRKRK